MSETLLLFGGWSRDKQSYQKLIGSAPKNWEIHFIPPEDPIFSEILSNNLSEVTLVGHSLGGVLAIEFTQRYPDKVKKLFLVDSEGVPGHKAIFLLIWNLLRTHAQYGGRKLFENLKALARVLKKPIFYIHQALFAHSADLKGQAKLLKVPTVIIWGEKDHLTPLWQGEKLHKWISGSKMVVLKDMDHDWIIHSPELFWKNFKK